VKVSIIISVYKDVEALLLILKSLEHQTYKNFEVVVAEDGEFQAMAEAVALAQKEHTFEIVHTTQEDDGVRKSRSQNNGIKASNGEYLIFIDGDCLLYSRFVENHLALSGEKHIVTGRRVNLGPKYSALLRDESISFLWLEKNFVRKYLSIKEDAKKERHSEEGFSLKANSFIIKLMKKLRKKEFPMLGCNMSFYKKAMLEINGFDEALGNSAMASDTDLSWRFKGLGYKIISARFVCNEFHLYHKRSPHDYDRDLDLKMVENQKNKIYRCSDGIEKTDNN
jgi:glycosyltransferase involved in cell wall biosynthesis